MPPQSREGKSGNKRATDAHSNFFVSKPQVMLSKKLVGLSGLDRVFFSNSGAESVEEPSRSPANTPTVTDGAAASSLWKTQLHSTHWQYSQPRQADLAAGIRARCPRDFQSAFNDIRAIRKYQQTLQPVAWRPVQGKGHQCSQTLPARLRELCDRRENIVLIFDEIQCEVARTGVFCESITKCSPI